MGNATPGENGKTSVVGNEADVAPPRFRVPADIAIPAAQMARRRTPRQARDRTALRPGPILGVFPNRLFVFQVVMMLHQAIEQRLVARARHLLLIDGEKMLTCARAWCR